MRFLFLIFISTIVLVFSQASFVLAQEASESDFAAAYKNHVNTYDVYQSNLSEYRLAKSQYSQAGTLVSQTKAQEATVEMLKSRDEVVLAYLTAIKMKVLEADGISESFREGLVGRINAEIIWFQDHLGRLDSAGSLEDLSEDSDIAAERFLETQRVVYDALGTVANGKVTTLRNELNRILSDTRQKNNKIKLKGDLDVERVDRWMSEIDNKLTRSLDKSIGSESQVQNLYGEKKLGKIQEIYTEVLFTLEDSVQLLRDGSRFMKEVLKVYTGEN